jgi:hypothetical protein
MKTFQIIAFLFCFIPIKIIAQTKDKTVATQYPTDDSSVIYGGTFAAVTLYANDLEQYKYNTLKRRVQKVYPYIELGKKILADMSQNEEDSKKKDYKKYVKSREEELRAKFEEELKNLTINEGLILVKLVNRETGDNCYSIIKNLKGSFNAFFWQQLGKRYGYDLKQAYIPSENPELEQAIEDLQTGGLVPALSKRKSK